MKICLLYINYNGSKVLEKNLLQITRGCSGTQIDIFVTDDNSSDNSWEIIKKFKVYKTKNKSKNRGFASNVNNGLKFSCEVDNYDFFIVSNSDLNFELIDFKYLKKIISKSVVTFPKMGILGFKEVNSLNLFEKSNIEIDINQVSDVSGCFFVITKRLINKIGYLDEEYYMYGEDNDYFFRCKSNNFLILRSSYNILHFSEGSSENHLKTSWLVYRNAGLFSIKNLRLISSFRYFFSFIYIIYNPLLKPTHPSVIRIKRSGFFINNMFLLASVIWNLKRLIVIFFKNKKP